MQPNKTIEWLIEQIGDELDKTPKHIEINEEKEFLALVIDDIEKLKMIPEEEMILFGGIHEKDRQF